MEFSSAVVHHLLMMSRRHRRRSSPNCISNNNKVVCSNQRCCFQLLATSFVYSAIIASLLASMLHASVINSHENLKFKETLTSTSHRHSRHDDSELAEASLAALPDERPPSAHRRYRATNNQGDNNNNSNTSTSDNETSEKRKSRFKRNQINYSSQSSTNDHVNTVNNNNDAGCPSNKLRMSLLPVELQQPQQQSSSRMANNNRQTSTSAAAAAYCECQSDFLGWQITCYDPGPIPLSMTASRQQQQHRVTNNIPHQFHPAFLLKSQQNQQARRYTNSNNRSSASLFDEVKIDNNKSSDMINSNTAPSSRLKISNLLTRRTRSLASNAISQLYNSNETNPNVTRSTSATLISKLPTTVHLDNEKGPYANDVSGGGLSSSDSASIESIDNNNGNDQDTVSGFDADLSHDFLENANSNNNNNNHNNMNYGDQTSSTESHHHHSTEFYRNNNSIGLGSSSQHNQHQIQGHHNSPEGSHLNLMHDTITNNDDESNQSMDGFISSPSSLSSSSSSSASSVSFQTIPSLFSIKYLRNTNIEIDCDQLAPNYRPAMFQGFNVDEIGTFTLNNCPLPPIPFSVIFHRQQIVGTNQRNKRNHVMAMHDHTIDNNNDSNNAIEPPNDDQTTAYDARQQRRRRVDETSHNNPTGANASPTMANANQQQQIAPAEPSVVKSLTINLNTIVDQRTLVTLLTGLDSLEELALNYMQLALNFTQLEPPMAASDLVAEPTNAQTTPHPLTSPSNHHHNNQINNFTNADDTAVRQLQSTVSSAQSLLLPSESTQQLSRVLASAQQLLHASSAMFATSQNPPLTHSINSTSSSSSMPASSHHQPTTLVTTTTTTNTPPPTTTTNGWSTTVPTDTSIVVGQPANTNNNGAGQTTSQTATTTTSTIGQTATSNGQNQTQLRNTPVNANSNNSRDRLLATPRGNILLHLGSNSHHNSYQPSGTTQPTATVTNNTNSISTTNGGAVDYISHTQPINYKQPSTSFSLNTATANTVAANTATNYPSHPSSLPSHNNNINQNNQNTVSAVSSSQILSSISYTNNNNNNNIFNVNNNQSPSSNNNNNNNNNNNGMMNTNSRIRQPIITTTAINQVPPGGRILQQAKTGYTTPHDGSISNTVTAPTIMMTTPTTGNHNSITSNSNNNNNNNNNNINNNNGNNFGVRTSSTNGQTISPPINTLRARQTTNQYTTTANNNNNNNLNGLNNNDVSTTSSNMFGTNHQQHMHFSQPNEQVTTASTAQQQQFVRPTTTTPSSSQTIIATTGGQTNSNFANLHRSSNGLNAFSGYSNNQQAAGSRLSGTSSRRFSSSLGPSTSFMTTSASAGSNTNNPTTNNNHNLMAQTEALHHYTQTASGPTTGSSYYRPSQSALSTLQSENSLQYPQSTTSNLYSNQPAGGTSTNGVPSQTTNHGDLLRLKRSSNVEFELSFGDLLPNLRSLKLESFIDMSVLNQVLQRAATSSSQLSMHSAPSSTTASTPILNTTPAPIATTSSTVNNRSGPVRVQHLKPVAFSLTTENQTSTTRSPSAIASPRHVAAAANLVRRQTSPATSPRRFRRQWSSGDMPEKDETFGEGDENALGTNNGQDDSLMMEESNVHHNVMLASSPSLASPTLSTASSSRWPASMESSHYYDDDMTGGLPSQSGPSEDDTSLTESSPESRQDNSDLNVQAAINDAALSNNLLVQQYSSILIKLFSHLTKLKILQLVSNDLPYLPDNLLNDSHHSLQRLYLMSNKIRYVSDDALQQQHHLETLDLTNNQLRQLSPKIFRDTQNLKQLRLRRNLLRSVPSKLFAYNQNRLEIIDLAQNRHLKQIPLDLFSSAGLSVTNLTFNDCQLNDSLTARSPDQLFASLPNLIDLNLQGNRLRSLLANANLFARNNRLQRINISRNQLNQLNGNLFNQNGSQIIELNLSHNKLQDQLPNQFLLHLRKLRKLNLSHNRFTQLRSNLFVTNQQLEYLDLSHNLLTTINTAQSQNLPFGLGASLKSLQLSHNNLSQFTEDIIDINWTFYSKLQLLDLSHNKFVGRISVPIFYVISDELHFNLGHNFITTLDVQALMQHEQTLSQFANISPASTIDMVSVDLNTEFEKDRRREQRQVTTAKLPIVDFKLTGNPIVCDCLLEPLVSYSRRVAAATNPSVAASIFSSSNEPASAQIDSATSTAAGSRYSLSNGGASSSSTTTSASTGKQKAQISRQSGVQIFYQFKFNDLYCAQPVSLQQQLLNHVSIGDLLCPIKDTKLCPSECQCHYQSSFKTVIVDCHNRKLSTIPKQLSHMDNFIHFSAQPATSSSNKIDDASTEALSNISDIDKLIIRLDSNQLTNMDALSQLFQPIDANDAINNNNNNNNLLMSGNNAATSSTSADNTEKMESTVVTSQPQRRQVTVTTRPQSQSLTMAARNQSAQINPESENATNQSNNQKKVLMSPVAMGRQSNQNKLLTRPIRKASVQRRQVWMPATTGNSDDGLLMEPGANTQHGGFEVVLETSEVYRSKNFMMTCELYLDNNQIETISDRFLQLLDKIPQTSMSSTMGMTSPQSALPTSMLAPPLHTKINDAVETPVIGNTVSENAGVDNNPVLPLGTRIPKLMAGGGDEPGINGNQEISLSSMRKIMVLPSLKILSLRNNRLQSISSQTLNRLSKLIKSSHTKIYLGHNPYNCSDNFSPASQQNSQDPLLIKTDEHQASSASALNDISSSAVPMNNLLEPAECPVGQLKNWLTVNHNNVGDLDEIYCTHIPDDLLAKIAPAHANSRSNGTTSEDQRKNLSPHSTDSSLDEISTTTANSVTGSQSSEPSTWEHEHPWSGSLAMSSSVDKAVVVRQNGTNSSNLVGGDQSMAPYVKLIEINLYDLCPYSPGLQLQHLAGQTGLLSAKSQQILLSLTIVFILLTLLLLIILIYFGDYQTIMAFIYIHMRPIYVCLNLNESHLDGDKLYDAFVSYSSSDRDIVMELIEKLEQQQVSLNTSAPTNQSAYDNVADVLVQDSDIYFKRNVQPPQPQSNNQLLQQRRTNSFQDLNTMTRSTSRIMMNEDSASSIDQINQVGSVSDWTKHEEANAKQKESTGYKLCIHERDWLPGHLISWNIVNSVQNSRRTILILSKEFIQSIWFKVEFHTAYYQMLEDKIDRLIVIVRGEMPPKEEMDKDLAFLLTTKTYLTWGEKWFWERLHYALPHKSMPPPSKMVSSSNTLVDLAKKKQRLAKRQQQQVHQTPTPQKPLLMSSIGKDCSNLLLPIHQQQQQSPLNTRSNSQVLMQTTENLGSPQQTLEITRSNDQLMNSTDSGRATCSTLTGGGVSSTRIMVKSNPDMSGNLNPSSNENASNGTLIAAPVPKSKVRTNKTAGQSQRQLQNYVDKTISNHFNLSEL